MACTEPNGREMVSDWERTARALQPMIATLFFLSSLRLLVAQLAVRVQEQWGLLPALLIGLAVVSPAALAIALKRHCTHPAVISALPLAMAGTRVLGQIFNRPDLNWICAGVTTMLYMAFLPLYAGWLATRESRGIYALTWGLLAAMPADLCLRAILASADPFFVEGQAALVIVLALAGVLASRTITWPRRTVREKAHPAGEGGWMDGLLMAGLGGCIYLAYTLYLNAALAGPLSNSPYPAAVTTSVGIAVLATTALYYDAEGVRLLDQNPLGTALLANGALLAATAFLTFYRPSHWNLPMMAVGLSALLVDLVIFGRLLVSSSGHPTHVLGVGLGLGMALALALIAPTLRPGADWPLLTAAGLTALAGLLAGARLRARECPARVIRPASWAWVASLALLVVTAGVLFIQPKGESPAPRPDVTLMTWNIQSGFGASGDFDLRRIAQAIREAEADVVALQEVNRGTALNGYTDGLVWLQTTLRRAGYLYWEFGPAESLVQGNAVGARYPIVANVNFPYDASADGRDAVLATRVKVGGRRVAVYSTQLTETQGATPERLRQVEQILALTAGEGLPKAIMGSFHAAPDSAEVQRLKEVYRDAYVEAGGPLPGYTYPADSPRARLDYLFVSEDLAPLEARAGADAMASDHLPVVVRVQIRP